MMGGYETAFDVVCLLSSRRELSLDTAYDGDDKENESEMIALSPSQRSERDRA